jgi:hypothetical protein
MGELTLAAYSADSSHAIDASRSSARALELPGSARYYARCGKQRIIWAAAPFGCPNPAGSLRIRPYRRVA